jgi:membrane protein YdbS with pleckstrin-like domain
MSGMGRDRSLAVGEQTVEALHPHWKTLAGPVVTAFVIVAALLVGEVLIPSGRDAAIERLAAAALAVVLLMWWLVYPLLRWRTTRYELTTKRLRLRIGVFARNGSDIPLSRITDVSFRESPLDRILGCGTLVVEAAGEHAEIILRQVPHVERVSATLFQLAEDERLRASAGTQDDRRSDQR